MVEKKEIAVSRLPVTPETRLRLKVFAAQNGLTFDKAINFLLNKFEKKKGDSK